jgi:hypothetical protein
LAQDEAFKNCREDWRASQAALRANGINQKMFIADCEAAAAARSGAASTSRFAGTANEPGLCNSSPYHSGRDFEKARVEE